MALDLMHVAKLKRLKVLLERTGCDGLLIQACVKIPSEEDLIANRTAREPRLLGHVCDIDTNSNHSRI